ncbi:MAG: hypothetical protein HY074_06455 [Deltaproteobacteria bacterium]|nr:hypothetical protein [Deltaproteobacteria bacterium]
MTERHAFKRLTLIVAGTAITAVFCAGLLACAEFFYRFKDYRPADAALLALSNVTHPLTGKVMKYRFTTSGNLRAISWDFLMNDEQTGNILRPNFHSRWLETKGRDLVAAAKVVRDVHYDMDAYGRRITPGQKHLKHKRERFLAFFGCSFTFGEWVDSNETLPYYVSQLATGYHAYNYGVSGYGPHSVLTRIKNIDLRQQIPQRQGIFIYTFMDDQVSRAIGTMTRVNKFAARQPFYELADNGQPVQHSSLSQGRPLRSWIYSHLGESALLRHFNVEYPWWIGKKDLDLVAALLAAMKAEFEREFPDSKFYVLFYPGQELARRIIPLLVERGVQSFDYSRVKLENEDGDPFVIPENGHPSAAAHQVVSSLLVRDLPRW